MPYPLHDPAATATQARDRGPIPESVSSGTALAQPEGAAGARRRPRRPAGRPARPALAGTRHPGRSPVIGLPGCGAPSDPDDPQAGTDAEAAAAAIAGLRWRLARQSTLEHPAVRRELRQLDEQLAAQLDQAARTPGRHRIRVGHAPGQPEPRHGDDTGQPGPQPAPVLLPGI